MSDENKTLTLEIMLKMQGVVEALEELVTKGGDADDRMIALQDTIKKMADIAGVGFEEAGKGVLKLSAALETVNVSVEQVATAVGNLGKESSEFEGIKTDTSVSEIAELSSSVDNLNSKIRETGEVAGESFTKAASDVEGSGLSDKIRDIGKSIIETGKEEFNFDFDAAFAATNSLRDATDAYKETVGDVAAETSENFKFIGDGIKDADIPKSVRGITNAVRELEVESGKLSARPGGLINADSSIVSVEKSRASIDTLKDAIYSVARATGESFKFAADGVKNSHLDVNVKDVDKAVRELQADLGAGVRTDSLSTLSDEMDRAKGSADGLRNSFDGMGTVAKTVFGFTLANVATRALRAVVGFIKEAITAGEEFNRSLFKMAVGVRALQRAGDDVTIGDFTDKIKELREEWGIFSERELVDSMASMALLTREVGLTSEMMFELIDASAALNALLGKDLDDSVRQISLAISSGYAEALQRSTLNVNKVEIANKGLEMGIDKAFMSMTGEERALVTLALILEQVANISEDAAGWQDTLGGSVDKSKASIKTSTDTMGQLFLPTWAKVVKLLADASVSFVQLIQIWDVAELALRGKLLRPIRMVTIGSRMMWKNLSGKGDYTLQDFIDAMNMVDDLVRDEQLRIMSSFDFPLKDVGRDAAESFEKGFNERLLDFWLDPAVADAFNELKDIIEDINEDIADEMDDFHQSQLLRQRKFSFRLEQLLIANAAAREKLIRKTNDRIEGENIKYQQNLADAHADYLQDQSDAELDYRRRELDAEQDYQDELRKMRDQLLFDLEEAVRQRDASQIRRLLRQAEFRKEQLGIDHERESEENRERLERELADNRLKLKRELEDIRRAHAIRLREIRIDGQRQLAELARTQQARLLALAEQERLERELAEEKHARELADIRTAGEERVRLWTQNFLDMYGITIDATDEIYKYLNGAFGPGGSIEGVFRYLTKMISQMVVNFQNFSSDIQEASSFDKAKIAGGGNFAPPIDATSWADGGTLIANKPTLAVFGDNGPERVDFTPIGRRGSDVGNVFGGALPSGSDAQKLALEILLSPDLEARITENTLGEFSDILVSVERTT